MLAEPRYDQRLIMSFVTGYAETRTEDGTWHVPPEFVQEAYPPVRSLFSLEALTPDWEMMFGEQAVFTFTKGFPEDASQELTDDRTPDGYYSWIRTEDLMLELWDSETLFVKMDEVPLGSMYEFADGSKVRTLAEIHELLDPYRAAFHTQEAIVYHPQALENVKHRSEAWARRGPVTWKMTLKEFIGWDLRHGLLESLLELSKQHETRLVIVEEM